MAEQKAEPRTEELYAVMIAVEGDTLLLPNAAVAEVMTHEALQHEDDMPNWLLGYCNYNQRRIPVIAFERLNGLDSAPVQGKRERIVVVNSLGTQLAVGAVAFLAQSYPHLVTLNRAAVKPLPLRATDRPDLVMARVKIANAEALIPDFETIEVELAAVV